MFHSPSSAGNLNFRMQSARMVAQTWAALGRFSIGLGISGREAKNESKTEGSFHSPEKDCDSMMIFSWLVSGFATSSFFF